MFNLSGLKLISPVLAMLLSACGGGSGSTPATTPNPAPSDPVIPPGAAVTPVAMPIIELPTRRTVPNDRAVLRHVYRDEFLAGIALPDATDSPNGRVEVRNLLGLYSSWDRNETDGFSIPLEDNGLAYFRVINTKPNGSQRVHLFHGVPAGEYFTLDSTDIDVENQFAAEPCVTTTIRLENVEPVVSGRRFLVNGAPVTDIDFANSQAAINNVRVCPLLGSDIYMAFVVEESPAAVRYGFEFYQDIADGDLLEVALDNLARMVNWTSDVAIDAGIGMTAVSPDWGRQKLYTAANSDDLVSSGSLPMFDALPTGSLLLATGGFDSGRGLVNHQREISPDSTDIALNLNGIQLSDVSLGPLSLTWTVDGDDQPQAVSGVIFNEELTQTYAYLSMDPDVLANAELDIPLEDLDLLLGSTLVTLGGFATSSNGNSDYLGSAGFYAGFFNGTVSKGELRDEDFAITADVSELLQLALELLEGQMQQDPDGQ